MSATDLYTRTNAFALDGGREVFEFVDGDLVDDDLQELVTLSLFTWRRALDADEVPAGESRQGWFADSEFGSRLWLLNYRRLDNAALADAKAYVVEALAWMVEDKIIERVTVEVERAPRGVYLSMQIATPRAPAVPLRYVYLTDGDLVAL